MTGLVRHREPEWVRHALWWHVYPLGFVGAEPRADLSGEVVQHRLGAIEGWLDHVLELGASGLLLGPVFASETHGYDTVDHFRIDPRLGDEADLEALVEAAGRRGIRVMLDGVFNHVARSHGAFAAVLAEGPSAPTASWFHLHWPGGADAWTPGAEPDYEDFEGHHHLVALNHAEPAVVDHVVEVMIHWLDRGIAGWRLDAAYAVSEGFWAEVADRVRARHPDAYLMGEVIHGDYPGFVEASHLDSLTQYELWKAIWSAFNDRNFHELAHALGRHDALLEVFVPFTFVGNHDVTRIASRLHDPRHLEHAVVVLTTVAGTPAVYSGDEHAFRGIKEDREGGDDAVRPPFPPSPGDLPPEGLPTFHHHQAMLGLRRRHPWLHTARTEVLHVSNEQIAYASTDGTHRLLVALSTAETPAALPVPGAVNAITGHGEVTAPGTAAATVHLPAHGWAVLTA